MFNLKSWSLHRQGTAIFAAGAVFDNPKFFNGEDITTSRIEKCEIKDCAIIATTHSGSVYEMKFEDCDQTEETKECLRTLGLPEEVWTECLDGSKEAKAKLLERVDKLLKSRELFVQIAGNAALVAFYKSDDNKTEEIPIDYHVGTFQDSVLIWNYGQVDFRFFPNGFNQLEPYHWSDGLERIHFENVGATAEFKGSTDSIELPTNSIITVESTAYRGEGLFSPDCVNGKSAFHS